MPYVNVPADLSRIQTKVAFNLTKRQLVCFGAAAAVGLPIFFLTRTHIGGTGAMFLMIGLMLPAFLLAMYERDGQPAEKVVRNVIRARFLWPGVRPYKTNNFYQWIVDSEKLTVEESALRGQMNNPLRSDSKTIHSPLSTINCKKAEDEQRIE